MTEYRVEYQILRREDGDEDFAEVGFGSSDAWTSLSDCAHMVQSAVENGEWATTVGQPAPADVLAAVTTSGQLELT